MSMARWMMFGCGIGLVACGVAASAVFYPQFAMMILPGIMFMFVGALMGND